MVDRFGDQQQGEEAVQDARTFDAAHQRERAMRPCFGGELLRQSGDRQADERDDHHQAFKGRRGRERPVR